MRQSNGRSITPKIENAVLAIQHMNGHFVFSNSMIAMPRGAIGKKSSTTDIAIAPSRAAVVIAQTKTGIQSNTAKITSTIDASSIWSFPNTLLVNTRFTTTLRIVRRTFTLGKERGQKRAETTGMLRSVLRQGAGFFTSCRLSHHSTCTGNGRKCG